MSFSSVINLGTVSPAITKVKISACTGSTCDNPVVITGYDNYDVWSGTKTISGIPDSTNFIKVEALGTCAGTLQCLQISGKPGTPTPTPTSTPTPTPTVTPTPTPTPTSGGGGGNSPQCYSYTVESSVEKNTYGVRYTGVGGASVDYKFNQLEDDGNGVYSICTIVEPTLLQFNGNVATGIGFAQGISRTGPNGSCSSNADCTSGGLPISPIDFNVSAQCVGYAPTGVTITVSEPSGGSETGYYVVMTSGTNLDSTHYSLPHSYSGLNNYVGNTYAFSVVDSIGTGGNKALTEDFNCASAPNNTAFANLVISSTKPSSAQCSSGTGYTFDLGSPSATFCTATTFTASGLTGLSTGNNYWLCYNGQTRQMFHPSNAGYFQQANGCQTI